MRKLKASRAVYVDGKTLTPEDVLRVANGAPCTLSPAARRQVTASRRIVERAAKCGNVV